MQDERTILVAVDLTDHAAGVIHAGVEAARAHGARLVLVHVVHELRSLYGVYLGGGTVSSVQDDIEANAREKLAEIHREFVEPTGIESRIELRVGVPWVEIIGAALHYAASQVVIGAHVGVKPEHRVIGSTVARVLREASCPILVVPPEP